MPAKPTGRNGFTLIEILVALAVFGLAAMALIKMAAESTTNAARIEQQALAGIVADRVATEVSLGQLNSMQGHQVMAGQKWSWFVVPVVSREGVRISVVQVRDDRALLVQRLAYRVEGAS